jgi:hypothetical protein
MTYSVSLDTVLEQPIAAAKQRTSFSKISNEIGSLLALPWVFVSEHPALRNDCFNVAIYWDDTGDGVIEVGVQVAGWFEATDDLVNSSTPSGTVARTAHYGPFWELGAAHEAVRTWCRENGHEIALPFWEIYGHWNDDPEKLRTDVVYLIK